MLEEHVARYQIMYWKDIPSQVKAEDEQGTVKALMPDRFQQAIDAAAMADGSTGTDAYLEGWVWGPKQERHGTAQEVLALVLHELETEYSPERIRQMIRTGKST